MPRYRFPGYSDFLHAAAGKIGRPEAEVPARRIATLTALANLCAQAAEADPAHAPGILAKADEFRDQLRAASEAADLMLAGVRRGLGPDDPARKRPPRPERPRESKPARG